MLAIVWANQFDTGLDDPNFDAYGANEAIARQIVSRAIGDWNAIITDQNFDNDNNPGTHNFTLKVFEDVLGSGGRGVTSNVQFTTGRVGQTGWAVGVPMSATITLDDNGGGDGWFFDETPLDDSEFTAIVNFGVAGAGTSFQASFVDATTLGQQRINDFYRTVTHEIGHALGVLVDGFQLDSGNFAWINASGNPVQNPFPANNVDPLLGQMTYVGFDQVNNLRLVANPDGISGTGDEIYAVNELWKYTLSSGATVTFTESGGAHFYEGPLNAYTPNATAHPNDLMNAGRTIPAGSTPPIETTRQWISDLDAQFLADAYGYQITLPSTLNTAHVTLDSLTGTLLVQGGVNSAGVAQSDAIAITLIGSDIWVQLYNSSGLYATERVPAANVTQIVVSRAGDNLSDPGSLFVSGVNSLIKTVYSVVSSNQDAIDAGSLTDGFVDLDTAIPGAQVSLRAAIQNANGLVGGSIYVPRGTYRLTLTGTGGDAQGDLDILKSTTIIGTGAGETVIDAGGDSGIQDRVFEVVGSGQALTLDSLTVTGGRAPSSQSTGTMHGGGIFVRDDAILLLTNSAVVGNKTTNTSEAIGGGIFFTGTASGWITNSVITDNHSAFWTGGVYLGGGAAPFGQVSVTGSIIAKNTAAMPTPPTPAWGYDIGAQAAGRDFTSGGNNRIGSSNPTDVGFNVTGDYMGNVNYIVTGVADSWNSGNDGVVLSVREAINKANLNSGLEEIWLPGWHFLLMRDRNGYGQGSSIDASVGFGDLDIDDSLTIRAVNSASRVTWRAGLAADKVFELLGDYNGNNSVDTADYVIWQKTLNSTTSLWADGDDNGTVQQADYYVWSSNYGNTLTLWGIQVDGSVQS